MGSQPLIAHTKRGLYCPPGDFYIDPERPVQTAVITHGHADHLRPGSARYILSRPGLAIARSRLPGRPDILPLDYGARIVLGSTIVSLHPAGHILGSAQVRIEHAGEIWVVSGDYKRQADPTCAAFEPLACDVFVSEATFAVPVYRWPSTESVIAEILAWWHANREAGAASLLSCYALGKAQRVLAELNRHTAEPIHVHESLTELIEVYRAAGIAMPRTIPIVPERRTDYRGALILAPPQSTKGSWIRQLGEHVRGFCSGWMALADEHRRRGYHRGFVLSDHADWPALLDTCMGSRAKRVFLMHGESEALARSLLDQGVDARPLERAARAILSAESAASA